MNGWRLWSIWLLHLIQQSILLRINPMLPCGMNRASMSHMNVFDTIYFEIGNETWNGLFRPWTFGGMVDAETGKKYARGEVYALMHDFVVEVLRSSPYWQPAFEETFIHVTGGWATSLRPGSFDNGYTQEIARASQHGEYVTIAAYNGGGTKVKVHQSPRPQAFLTCLVK